MTKFHVSAPPCYTLLLILQIQAALLTSREKALLEQNSPDDVQIDIDVPRTITHHIMFRKRYRGG